MIVMLKRLNVTGDPLKLTCITKMKTKFGSMIIITSQPDKELAIQLLRKIRS